MVEPGSLVLLTQNLWCHYPMTLLKQCPYAMSGARFEDRLKSFSQYISEKGIDVVLCQELFLAKLVGLTRHNFDCFSSEMESIGLIHRTDPNGSMQNRWLWGQNSGLAIFSRFPLHNSASFDFAVTSEWNSTKGFVCADVYLANERRLHLVNTHLDARAWSSKKEQIAQIGEHLHAEAAAARSVGCPLPEFVVCGDFNVCPQTAGHGGYDDGSQYRYLCEVMAKSGLEDLWNIADSVPTHEEATLDHIFLGKSAWDNTAFSKQVVWCTNDAGLTISDHGGLAVRLTSK